VTSPQLAPDGRNALLAAISNPDTSRLLKRVVRLSPLLLFVSSFCYISRVMLHQSVSLTLKNPSVGGDDGSLLQAIAKALIERRANMKEGEDRSDEDDDELVWN
jgi:hypothetical protein